MPRLDKLRHRLQGYKNESGASAAEFALTLPVLLLLIFSTIGVSMMIYATAAMHFAAEDAARCVSVQTTVCTGQTSAQTRFNSTYVGPTISITNFTLTAASDSNACNAISVTANYTLSTGLGSMTVPLSAKACYPAG